MKHVMTSRYLAILLGLAMFTGVAATLAGQYLGTRAGTPTVTAWGVKDLVGYPVGSVVGNGVWDAHLVILGDPFTRCLDAMEAAQLPAWMWECREVQVRS